MLLFGCLFCFPLLPSYATEAINPQAIALYEEGLVDEKNFDRVKHFLRSLSLIVERLYPAANASPAPTINTTDSSSTTTASSDNVPTPKSGKAKGGQATPSNQALQSPAPSSPAKESVEKLAKPLFALLAKTKTKANARAENTHLYFVLMSFARNNKAVEQQAEKEGIWTYFFSPTSFILSEGYCERLDVSAYPVLYKIFGALLEDYKKYKLLPASRYFFYYLFIYLCGEVFYYYGLYIYIFLYFSLCGDVLFMQ